MRKNTAGQKVHAGVLNLDGSDKTTGAVTVYVLGDAGTQAAGSVGSGAATSEGNGLWSYAPSQAETNYDEVTFTFKPDTDGTTAHRHYSPTESWLDAIFEGSLTIRHFFRIAYAVLAGKASGLDAGAPKYRDSADSKDRVSAVTDAHGNRSSVTVDGT